MSYIQFIFSIYKYSRFYHILKMKWKWFNVIHWLANNSTAHSHPSRLINIYCSTNSLSALADRFRSRITAPSIGNMRKSKELWHRPLCHRAIEPKYLPSQTRLVTDTLPQCKNSAAATCPAFSGVAGGPSKYLISRICFSLAP